MMDNPFYRYFSFWFAELANGEKSVRSVCLEHKEYYIRTREAALKHGPISEDFRLKERINGVFSSLENKE